MRDAWQKDRPQNKHKSDNIFSHIGIIMNSPFIKGGVFMKFYVCDVCGNFVGMVKESGVSMMCCGTEMTEVIPVTSDVAKEKHVPVITVKGNKVVVKVGSEEHPMLDNHFIEWIALETVKGSQRKELKPGEKPCAEFALTDDDSVVCAYAYCNLHKLWKSAKIC